MQYMAWYDTNDSSPSQSEFLFTRKILEWLRGCSVTEHVTLKNSL